MSGALENPLVRQCRELAERVANGWTDGPHAAAVLSQRAQDMAASLEPARRDEFLNLIAGQIEEAGRATVDTEVFEIFARWLRTEAARNDA